MNLKQFITQTYIRNAWIEEDYVKIYVRKSIRNINGKLFHFLDLASIEVEEEYQNSGIFTKLITDILSIYPDLNIFVEAILNPIIPHVLNKFDFIEQSNEGEFQFNMYLLKEL